MTEDIRKSALKIMIPPPINMTMTQKICSETFQGAMFPNPTVQKIVMTK